MIENILRRGVRSNNLGFKSSCYLGGVGHIEVYKSGEWAGRVFVHFYSPSRSFELYGFHAAVVRGIMAMQS